MLLLRVSLHFKKLHILHCLGIITLRLPLLVWYLRRKDGLRCQLSSIFVQKVTLPSSNRVTKQTNCVLKILPDCIIHYYWWIVMVCWSHQGLKSKCHGGALWPTKWWQSTRIAVTYNKCGGELIMNSKRAILCSFPRPSPEWFTLRSCQHFHHCCVLTLKYLQTNCLDYIFNASVSSIERHRIQEINYKILSIQAAWTWCLVMSGNRVILIIHHSIFCH